LKTDVQYYIEKFLADYGKLVTYVVPVTNDLFMVGEKELAFLKKDRKAFHMTVVRLLFLLKRARPNISLHSHKESHRGR
jgi:hypothetical protein